MMKPNNTRASWYSFTFLTLTNLEFSSCLVLWNIQVPFFDYWLIFDCCQNQPGWVKAENPHHFFAINVIKIISHGKTPSSKGIVIDVLVGIRKTLPSCSYSSIHSTYIHISQ